jgi:hypothetical protein
VLGDTQDAVGDAVHVGRERLRDNRDPHAHKVKHRSIAPGHTPLRRGELWMNLVSVAGAVS